MGFFSNLWGAAKAVGKGVLDIFVGISAVLVLTVYAIGYVIFTIAEHLYNWIDGIFESGKQATGAVMVPPEDTEAFIKTLSERGTVTLEPYSPRTKRSLMFATDRNGNVVKAQVTSTTKGFDTQIQAAFDKGDLVEQPIAIC